MFKKLIKKKQDEHREIVYNYFQQNKTHLFDFAYTYAIMCHICNYGVRCISGLASFPIFSTKSTKIEIEI